VYDYYLPPGLFGINLTKDEIDRRESSDDYFGWHIERPTKNFIIQVQFPKDIRPKEYWGEVKYAAAAGETSRET